MKKKTPTKSPAPKPEKGSKKKSTQKVEPKTVVAEIVEDHDQPDRIEPELETDKAYSVPSDRDIEEEFGLDEDPSKNLVPVADSKALTTTDPLAMYLAEIRKYPVLSREEELKIAKKYFETKDPEAAQILIKSNLRFVVKVAAEYSKFGAKMIDLVQEGNVGLMHAVRDFNPYKGARLITYAVWWIRGYIKEFLMRQYSMVRIGTTQNQRKLFYQLQKEKDALDALGQEPDIALLSSRLGIPADEVEQMAQRMSGRDVSLDRPIDEDSGTSLLDLQRAPDDDLSVDEKLERQEQLEILKATIEKIRPDLNEKEKIILDERVLNDDPLTLQEIGEKYKITREAVRQAEARLMKKIKDKMEEEARK